MCNVISLKALEKDIKSELSSFGLVLSEEETNNIKSFALFVSCVPVPEGKTLKWISTIEQEETKWDLAIQIEKSPEVYNFILSNGGQVHEWNYTPCYVEQKTEQIDSKAINTDKVFEDIVHLVDDKSLYSRTIYKGDIRLISEEAQKLKDAAYSAVSFFDATVNDCIYQESTNVKIFNENYSVIKYPFHIRNTKGSFIFNVAKNQEVAAVSYTLIYEGFECPVWDVLIVNL